MGPGDPFGGSSAPPRFQDYVDERRDAGVAPRVGLGLALGLLFGVVAIWKGPLSALVVLACGGLGVVTASLLQGIRSGRLDVRAAYRALRGEGP